jgi:hypothetical protein
LEKKKQLPALLLQDNAKQHGSFAAWQYAKAHGLFIVGLPAHSTSRTQVNDGVFFRCVLFSSARCMASHVLLDFSPLKDNLTALRRAAQQVHRGNIITLAATALFQRAQ